MSFVTNDHSITDAGERPPVPLIPVEDFFAAPAGAAARISPDWSRDGRWLLYSVDNDGDEHWHLFRVDPHDPHAEPVDLTPFPDATVVSYEIPVGRPGTAMLTVNNRKLDELDLVEVDLTTGELTVLAENPGHVGGWCHSSRGDLFAYTRTADGTIQLSRWDTSTHVLTPAIEYDGTDYPNGLCPTQMTPDGDGVWIGSYQDSDQLRLVRLDVNTGQETVVAAHPSLELDTRAQVFSTLPGPLNLHPTTGDLLGVRFQGERQLIQAVDPRFAEVLDKISGLSEGVVGALSCDRSLRRWTVSFVHDRDPGVTYFYDHTTGEGRLLHRPYPHLDPAQLAPMKPVTITSRDGLRLPSYLTLPVGMEAKNLPLVLVVHGGPWTSDDWGYAGPVQLLANRGYAVLQVNFRGSTGFGKAFMKAGIGELAGKMHDDLIDGVRWAADEGYADPRRVAIYGGSYGGYAALVGAAFTPDVFACAIDYVGISNLFPRTHLGSR